MAPGVALGDALTWLEEQARAILPARFHLGLHRIVPPVRTQGSALIVTFFLSLL